MGCMALAQVVPCRVVPARSQAQRQSPGPRVGGIYADKPSLTCGLCGRDQRWPGLSSREGVPGTTAAIRAVLQPELGPRAVGTGGLNAVGGEGEGAPGPGSAVLSVGQGPGNNCRVDAEPLRGRPWGWNAMIHLFPMHSGSDRLNIFYLIRLYSYL